MVLSQNKRFLPKRILSLLLFCTTLQAAAQTMTVEGVVTDSLTGETLPGVSISWASGRGTSTDLNGAFSFELPAGEHRVIFTCVGYDPEVRMVRAREGGSQRLDVRMSPATNVLDMVVISAGKFEQRVGEVTQSLSVIPTELVRNKNIVSLDDAMQQCPGVVVVDNDPQIRAGSGFSYGAGSRVMMLVDDLPILSGDIGRPSWTFLPIENLEQVEVIKGASSVLYGSAALTGVINVRTAYPRAEPSTRVNVFGGVYDTPGHAPAKWWGDNPPLFTGANFFHSRQVKRWDVVVGGNAFSDAGYIGPEVLDPDTLAADPNRIGPGGYENRIRANAGVRYRFKDIRMDVGVNANAMKSRSTSVFIWDDTDRGLYRPQPGTVTRTLGGQYYIDPFLNYWSAKGTHHSLKSRYYQQRFDNDNDQSNGSHLMYAEYRVQQKAQLFGETTITAGVSYQGTVSSAALYAGDPDGNGDNTATTAAAFVQVDKKLWEKLSLSAGFRYEQFTVNEDEQAVPVFRAGATYQLLQATFLRASYGQGFRFPTIGERYISTSVGGMRIYPNPDLQPEQSWNAEAGVKQGFKLGSFTGYADAVFFQQEFEDYIEFTFGQWATFTWADPIANFYGLGFKSLNTGGARVTGFELEVTARGRLKHVELTALMGYTHTVPVSTTPDLVYAEPVPGPPFPSPPGNTDPYIIVPASTYTNTSSDPSDNILKFRVQDLFRADVQAEYRALLLGASVRYNSHVRNIDQAFVGLDEEPLTEDILPTGVSGWMDTHTTGDWIVDARIGTRLGEHARVAFIVNNLTNEVYAIRPLAIEAPRSMQVQLTYAL